MITEIIRSVRDEMIADGYGENYADINNGNCDAFADLVMAKAMSEHPELSVKIVEREISAYFIDCDNDGSPLNRETLLAELPEMTPPNGISWTELDEVVRVTRMGWGLHVFLVSDGKAYDSETPDGVKSIFELPFYIRFLSRNAEKCRNLLNIEAVSLSIKM